MKKVTYYCENRAHYTLLIVKFITSFFWFFVNHVSAWWWGVKLGSGCRFRGKVYFNRLQGCNIEIGKDCIFNSSKVSNLIGVYSPCMISTVNKNAKIEIGDGCGFSGTVIGAGCYIKLGKGVRCGANTLITDTDWHIDDYRTGEDKPIIIEDNVWLGYGVKVLKGVRIGENSFIGLNSVVTKDIPANVIAAGNPCRVIKNIKR
jgi:acetyltransferase-like isoleucine patch superfamily enzyme